MSCVESKSKSPRTTGCPRQKIITTENREFLARWKDHFATRHNDLSTTMKHAIDKGQPNSGCVNVLT